MPSSGAVCLTRQVRGRASSGLFAPVQHPSSKLKKPVRVACGCPRSGISLSSFRVLGIGVRPLASSFLFCGIPILHYHNLCMFLSRYQDNSADLTQEGYKVSKFSATSLRLLWGSSESTPPRQVAFAFLESSLTFCILHPGFL